MDYLNHSNHQGFIHKLYGQAYIMPNKSFKTEDNPIAFDYILENSMIIRQSSFEDAGYHPSNEVLIKLNYIII